MTESEYQAEALKTLSLNFNPAMLPEFLLTLTCRKFLEDALKLDGIKKTLFYGKPLKISGLLKPELYDGKIDLTKSSPILLHGVIGMITEMAEVLEVLMLHSNGEITDEELLFKLQDEFGDVLWYLTAAFSALPFTPDEIRQANIKKLRQRYSGAFNADEAINKNHNAEKQAILGDQI